LNKVGEEGVEGKMGGMSLGGRDGELKAACASHGGV
jgi:hypothetical protein